jgi:G3E family GTPase
MQERITNLILITGFLGSGKTTFLENLSLPEPPPPKGKHRGEGTAVVINEQGRFSLCRSVKHFFSPCTKKHRFSYIPDTHNFIPDILAEYPMAIRELSQMGPSLMKIMGPLTSRYDRILVETSGLAPAALIHKMIEAAETQSGSRLKCQGSICIIDALRFLKLFSTVIPLYEQAASADFFVLSKTDLAEKKEVNKIMALLKTIRPAAPILIREDPSVSFQDILKGMRRNRY